MTFLLAAWFGCTVVTFVPATPDPSDPSGPPAPAPDPVTDTEESEDSETGDTDTDTDTGHETEDHSETEPDTEPPPEPERAQYTRVNTGYSGACAYNPGEVPNCWFGWKGEPLGPVLDVCLSGSLGCAILPDGVVTCYDDLTLSDITPPEGIVATQLSCSVGHACALTLDGSIECWGDYSVGGARYGMGGHSLKVVSDDYDNCALSTDGSVHCWGNAAEWGIETNRYDMSAHDADLLDFDFDASAAVGCGIQRDLTLTCWGDLDHPIVQRVPEGTYRDVALTYRQACAVATDGAVVCWGDDATLPLTLPEVDVPMLSIDARYVHFCGISVDSYVECWGGCGAEGCEDHP
jgi:hypothetical protein